MSISNKSVFCTLPRTQRGHPLVLGGDPKGTNFLYPNGHSIIIRNIDNPSICDIYTEHSAPTTVAKYSPSGFYICSADQSGKVRIWDTTQKEHILKNEFQPFAGVVKDLSWSADSQRIVAVGEGREKFAHVFMAETGTSVGEINGHSKIVNSCDFRPTRPFRIITGSEDNFVGIYEGPPFKFKHQLEDHTRFVQAVRFSPDGNLFASGGFDGKLFIYKANDYSKVGELGSPAHAGGIYALSWSPDGKSILSASGDKTCKMWQVESLQLVTTFNMGSDLMDQQVSCLWQGNHMLSTSLAGFINYLDVNKPDTPLRVIKGHNKSITALSVHQDPGTQHHRIYTASHDGFITHWDSETGDNDRVSGSVHTNQVQDMVNDGQVLYSCGLDDTIRVTPLTTNETSKVITLESQPRGLDLLSPNKWLVIAGFKDVTVMNPITEERLCVLPVTYEPTSVSCHPTDQHIAIGGNKDNKVHVYTFDGTNLTEKVTMDHREGVSDVAYSPDGKYLAAGDSNRKIMLYNVSDYELAHQVEWGFHMAKVNCLSWSPDSIHLASGSLDTNIIIWDVSNPSKHITLKKAHPQSQITRISWIGPNQLVSTGQDSNLKTWTVSF